MCRNTIRDLHQLLIDQHPMSRFLFTPLLICLLFSSCSQQEEQIRQYRVAKESSTPASSPTMNQTGGGQVWFFKLLTKEENFERFSNDFARMIIGADASASVPEFTLPTGWKATSGPAPIYQTIQVSKNSEDAALTVTPLPAPTSNPVEYLKSNVDRWRSQIGLPPLSSKDWLEEAMNASEIVAIPKGEQFVTLVHLQGKTEKFGKTEMLVAILSPQSLTGRAALATRPDTAPAMSPATSGSAASSGKVKYDLPEGWKESPGNAMRLVSLAAEHEAGAADVSVIRLPGGGDLLPNINRWRGQVMLDPIQQSELETSLEEVTVDGIPGQLSLLAGPEQSILIAIIEQQGVKWFFKMQGPTATVEAEQAHFREFLKSVKMNLESE